MSPASKDDLIHLFLNGRFVDIRVRQDGREYFFEGEFLRSIFSDLYFKNKKEETVKADLIAIRKILPIHYKAMIYLDVQDFILLRKSIA